MGSLYRIEDVDFHYGGRSVLSIPEFTLNPGSILGVVGPNGSGKSTLLRLLAFMADPAQGKIFFKGVDGRKITLQQRRNITILPQEPYLLKRDVYENIIYGLKIRGDRQNLNSRVTKVLDLVGLPEQFAKRSWRELSGGEVQRVALAARLILRPEVLILDEPTASVDVSSAQSIMEAVLYARHRWGTTVLIASHDHGWLEQVCDQQIMLLRGRLLDEEVVNMIPGPWMEQADCGRVIKRYPGGEIITLSMQGYNGQDSVALLPAESLSIQIGGHKGINSDSNISADNILPGRITALRESRRKEIFIVEVVAAGSLFRLRTTANRIEIEGLFPGRRVKVILNCEHVRWL